MKKHTKPISICVCMIAIYMCKRFPKRRVIFTVMGKNSILTPSSDFFTDSVCFHIGHRFNSGTSNNLHILWCIMGPVKIVFNQGL